MGVLVEHGPSISPGAGTGLAIPLKEAVRAFREWKNGSVTLQIFYLGKAADSDGVRVSMNGLVTLVDPRGVVTVSGGGQEIRLDLNICECSIAKNSFELQSFPQSLASDSALRLAFPNGAVCLIVLGIPDSKPQPSVGPSVPFQWLQNKLARPAVQHKPVKEPPAEPSTQTPVKRKLCVDVHRGQASIVEFVDTGNGRTRIRRLKEQFLSRADRAYADRLKRKIAYGENGGTYDLDGLYSPKTIPSSGELLQLVESLERKDGEVAWDRRRYPR